MDLKELKTFQTILQEGTFSKAAVKLNYAQSTITNQIQRLEKELGLQLFKRGWEAELTPSGGLFAQQVDQLIRHWEAVAEHANALEAGESGTLNIGYLESLPPAVLPNTLRRFRETKPGVACNFVMGNTDYLSRHLLDRKLDAAVCGLPAEPADLHFEPLYEERIVFIAKNDHPLARLKENLSFEELLPYPLVVGGPTCLYHLRLARQLAYYDQSPFLYTVTHLSSIPLFAAQINGVGMILESTPVQPDLVRLPVQLEDPAIPVGLLQHRKEQYPSAAKRLFLQFIKEELTASGLAGREQPRALNPRYKKRGQP